LNFLNPAAFAFLAIVPIVVLLYLLKLKRKPLEVSSTLFWFRAIQDLEANAPFQKLRKNLLLLLQILLLLLLIVALARPFLQAEGRKHQTLALILDGSGSMQALDVAPSRFEAAREKAGQLIRDLSEGDQALLILAAGKARVLYSLSRNKEELLAALAGAQPGDTETDLTEAFLLAQSLLQNQAGAELTILSDGGFPALPPLTAPGVEVRFVPVGQRCHNLALTALDVRPDPSDSNAWQLFASAANFSPEDATSGLDLSIDGQIVDSQEIFLPSGGSAAQVFRLSGVSQGVLEVRLSEKDDLETDNRAMAVFSPEQTTDVLVAGEPNFFLEHVLSLDPRVRLSTAPGVVDLDLESYDLVFFNGAVPESIPAGLNAVYIACVPASSGAKVESPEREYPAILDWNRSHPLMRFVSLDQVSIAKAFSLTPPPMAETLIESPGGPLLAVSIEQGRFLSLFIPFDLFDSNWMLRASFPIFITNLIDFCRESPGAAGTAQQTTGRPVPIYLGSAVSESRIEVRSPKGEVFHIAVNGDPVYFDSTQWAGLYEVKAGGKTVQQFAVNLLSMDESNIAPRSEIQLGGETLEAQPGPLRTNREIWKSLALIGLLILMLEWWVYHRRIGV
jgi:hypothetical protein